MGKVPTAQHIDLILNPSTRIKKSGVVHTHRSAGEAETGSLGFLGQPV